MIKKHSLIKEACVQTCEEAMMAEERGADRIELCKRLDLAGLTPKREIIEKTLLSVSIPIKVMIRSRKGNFVYDENELQAMEKEIDVCKSIGVNEVVFGILNLKGKVDIESSRRLAVRAYPMAVTFHKAIDHTTQIIEELHRLKSIPQICSVLTSGGKMTAIEGSKTIREIINIFGDQFNIIAAGSITEKNFNEIHSLIHSKEYHGKNIVGKLN